MHAARQAKRCVGFLLEEEMPGRERGAEAERACRQHHVLDGGVDGGAGHPVGIGPVLQAGDDPDRRLVEMVGQIFDRGMLAEVAFLGDAGRRLRW